MNYFFVLGARDPEMVEIARVLEEQHVPYAYALNGRYPVRPHEAYAATGIQGLVQKDRQVVFVECAVLGLIPSEICDHHYPGDPGYGKGPEHYMESSSLGQVLKLLGLQPTNQQRLIAAADHCLRHAYAGLCPGVDPAKLIEWRERSRAELRGISIEEMRSRIEVAMQAIKQARRIKVAGEDVAFFPPDPTRPEELREASARMGVPLCYIERTPHYGHKGGIVSAAPEVVDAWMKECGLRDIYGDPARGFAGGYF